jgi:hypothetical protein
MNKAAKNRLTGSYDGLFVVNIILVRTANTSSPLNIYDAKWGC